MKIHSSVQDNRMTLLLWNNYTTLILEHKKEKVYLIELTKYRNLFES